MSDKLNNADWQPWKPNELTQWEKLRVKPEPADDSLETSEHDEILEQAAMLDNLKEQARQAGHEQGFTEGQAQGYDNGYQSGLEAGLEQGLKDASQQQQLITEQWQNMLADFRHSLEALDTIIASRLMQLSLTATKQILGQPAICDGTALLNQIREFIQQEPMFSGKPQLRVHPQDIPLVEQQLGTTLSLHGWRLLADNKLHPGGCKISADEGDLDASLATRWHELCRLAAPGEL
ncbi:flagellar assembly protein FliH [Photorhabdus tasmaniensis]|uniref:Flagellar assembly protein FliH n=1 Tax=Photorhabdus tasmaniensis TaxID=1004159 RepID=A0ABX0GGB8_9GAMM|nr:flagellar assembly protein FliH [Photorhabdus tasmaniensis]NHB87824.1 flagellar assembly protein FliH [Photorhabdus tasmaniensis]